jgi:hypothetical protein
MGGSLLAAPSWIQLTITSLYYHIYNNIHFVDNQLISFEALYYNSTCYMFRHEHANLGRISSNHQECNAIHISYYFVINNRVKNKEALHRVKDDLISLLAYIFT